MAERFPNFEIQEIQELKENSENQNTKKSTSTWLNVLTSWAENMNFETNFLAFILVFKFRRLQIKSEA